MLDLIVVGGGLSGLTAALVAARAGASVAIFEASELGGRARSQDTAGFTFNLGPHALYRKGEGLPILKDLGVSVRGASPPSSGLAFRAETASLLPVGLLSLLSTDLLSLPSKLEVARFLASLNRVDTEALASVSVSAWLASSFAEAETRDFLAAVLRLSTYVNAPHLLSAGTAIERLRLAARGVLYLDDGWQTLVDGLALRARETGVLLHEHSAVRGIEITDRGFRVRRDRGTSEAAAVIVAVSPSTAARLLEPHVPSLARGLVADHTPVRAACLDIALDRLPRPKSRFALGIDEPIYLSLHSDVAHLSPPGSALLHVAWYLEPGDRGEPYRPRLEAALERLQPGWRAFVHHLRFFPDLIVSHAIPEARLGGARGRPGIVVGELPGLFLSGDWVGPVGHLADAALASARDAARAALAYTRRLARAA